MIEAPRLLVAGIGCTSTATSDEIVALVESALATAGHSPEGLACLATIDSRVKVKALHAAASRFGVPLRCFSSTELAAESSHLATPSASVAGLAGILGIAEAAALKAGPLLVPKQKSAHATCAIGLAATPLVMSQFGRSAEQ
jgi:cobalt-precorrin 5A hydrolase/precorrin-3B C17-methyltransferase